MRFPQVHGWPQSRVHEHVMVYDVVAGTIEGGMCHLCGWLPELHTNVWLMTPDEREKFLEDLGLWDD